MVQIRSYFWSVLGQFPLVYKYTNDSDITRKALIFLLETICVLLKYIQVNEVSDNA